ncbi:MAG: sensor histidine kinase [Cyclobacteriaceae bacterium]
MTPTKRIAIILTVVFLIPALFFSVYEISGLSKDEELIEEIYQKQLEAILFSANQYSDDILNSWISKTEVAFENQSADELPPSLETMLTLNSSIKLVFISKDTVIHHASLRSYSLDTLVANSIRESVVQGLGENGMLIQQLIKYKKSGFQKIVMLPTSEESLAHLQVLIFIVGSTPASFKVAGFVVDPDAFVNQLVGPRLQVISKDQFILSVYDKTTKSNVYSTLTLDTASLNSAKLVSDFWIFPNYALGIRTQGSSIQQLVRERTSTNLILLIGLDVILIVALFLVFRNVKKEVQLAQNKSDFVSNVSHEIRTPLALISMFAETLEMDRVPSEQKKKEYYTIISKETQRLTGIVNKILNFSQTEAGKKKLNIERVELAKEIRSMLATYDFHLRNKGFEYTFESTSEVWVNADRETLMEMIINLVDNAIKYSVDNKKISIGIGTEDGMGWVAVKDNGAGISRHDQKHIFDKFYRVSTGDLAKSPGTGLGLSFVKQLIEQQDGEIAVDSEPGKGSTFYLYFPLAQ